MLGIQRNRRNLCIYSLIFAVIQLHCIRCVYIRQLIAVYHRVEHLYIIYSGLSDKVILSTDRLTENSPLLLYASSPSVFISEKLCSLLFLSFSLTEQPPTHDINTAVQIVTAIILKILFSINHILNSINYINTKVYSIQNILFLSPQGLDNS